MSWLDNDAALYERDRAVRTAPWDETAFRRVFRHEIASVNGPVRIHYRDAYLAVQTNGSTRTSRAPHSRSSA
jgi:hypothetical protein